MKERREDASDGIRFKSCTIVPELLLLSTPDRPELTIKLPSQSLQRSRKDRNVRDATDSRLQKLLQPLFCRSVTFSRPPTAAVSTVSDVSRLFSCL